ncbi:MAG: helix-turn-helix domain-containing protein [Anaerolineae bacterium]
MGELGSRLREAREALGLSLEQVEDATRIRAVFLQALEEERFADLPGDVYVRGFVRNYAQVLKLDADELLASQGLSHEAAVLPRAPMVLNEPLLRTGGTLLPRVLLAVLIVALVGLGTWAAYGRLGQGADPWSSLLALWQARAPEAETLESNTPLATPQVTPDSSGLAETPEPTTSMPTEVAPTATPTPTRPAATRTPTMAPTATADPALVGAIVVEAEFSAPTYVDVLADGERLYVGTLTEGDRQIWTAESTISLRVGNAGGLSLTVNGVEVPPLGASGEVIDVQYDLENLPTD